MALTSETTLSVSEAVRAEVAGCNIPSMAESNFPTQRGSHLSWFKGVAFNAPDKSLGPGTAEPHTSALANPDAMASKDQHLCMVRAHMRVYSLNSQLSCFHCPNARITDVYHHTLFLKCWG